MVTVEWPLAWIVGYAGNTLGKFSICFHDLQYMALVSPVFHTVVTVRIVLKSQLRWKHQFHSVPYPYSNALFATQDTNGMCLNMRTLCRVSHIGCPCQYQSMEILINYLHPNTAIQLTLYKPMHSL